MRKKKEQQEVYVTEDTIKEATGRLNKYLEKKQSIDARVNANEDFWRQRHWDNYQVNDGCSEFDEKPVSAWMFNSLANKHADIMDNYPKPNILPRTEADEADAKMLSDIIPMILERNDYEELYSNKHWYRLKNGTCVTGVFWDNAKADGKGDITIKKIDLHNLAWEMGVDDIQDSREVFVLSVEDNETLEAMYPQLKGHLGMDVGINKIQYRKDYAEDLGEYSTVVDWYYKVKVPRVLYQDDGTELVTEKTILHYAKFCNDVLLYSSENNDELREVGYYEHGLYPFVFDTLFPIEEEVVGFGYIDVMRDPQKYIDKLDQMINRNAYMIGNPRYFVKNSAGINKDQFADWSNQIVEVAGDVSDSVKEIQFPTIPTAVMTQKESKIEELKETSGNRDFSQGSTSSGVTAASAIAALQEAGSKLSRDMIRASNRAFCKEMDLVVELIRQFYIEPRDFRIDRDNGEYEFIKYDNSNINRQAVDEAGNPIIDDNGKPEMEKPVFDIKISAEKKSPFSRAAQNELAKEMYGMGWFNPNNAEPSLIAIDMMEFEGKEKVKQQIQQQSMFMQQFNRMQQTIMQADATFPQLGLAVQAGLAEAPMFPQQTQAPQGTSEGSGEGNNGLPKTDNTMATKMRTRAAEAATPR